MEKTPKAVGIAAGRCLCGKVCFEIDTPARWAWHDHSAASRRAHGAAYATYVGSWHKRFRIIKGKADIARFEIDTPARWAWHDHSAASRRAHGAAYATYVGSWHKRFRIIKGKADIARFEDKATKTLRGFCARCGTPLFYERARSPHMVNIPRALFSGRTGRQPLYHIAIEELQEWAWTGEPLVPLKGFPGVVWQRSKRKKRLDHEGLF